MNSESAIRLLAVVSAIVLTATSGCDAGEEREWTDSSRSFRIKAEFLSLDGSTVLLKEKNGRKRSIPLSRLSAGDQKIARELAEKKESDPFKAVDEDAESDADEPEMKSSKTRPSRRSRKAPTEQDEDDDQQFEIEGEEEDRPPVIKPKWKNAPEIQLISKKKKKWQITVTPTEPLDYEPDLTELPEKRDFFERESGFAINSQARTAVMSYTLESRGRMGRTGEVSSRFVVMNIEKGRVTANAVTKGKWKVATIHPDGERFVLIGEDGEDSGILATCTANGSNFEMEERWR
ncbi:MAG: SHD1 domain-containing protein, partial [Planctomyces sp.]